MQRKGSSAKLPKKKPLVKRIFLFIAGIIAIFLKLLFPSKLKIERVRLPIQNLEKCTSLQKLKIIHLSDFHYDFPPFPQRISPKLIEQIIEITHQEQPDFIFLTGDFVQQRADPVIELAEKYFKQLKANYGIYGVLGNHDYKDSQRGKDIIMKNLNNVGVKMLLNERVFPLDNIRFEIVGFGDYPHDFDLNKAMHDVAQVSEATSSKPDPVVRIVLSHNPDSAERLKNYQCDLILSGHTHGGQICWPFTNKPILPLLVWLYEHSGPFKNIFRPIAKHFYVVTHWEWTSGLHAVKRPDGGVNMLYTNRGLATHPPIRLFCDPELTVIELVNKIKRT
jgi:predicted MPP superfamily phosphohydrolase